MVGGGSTKLCEASKEATLACKSESNLQNGGKKTSFVVRHLPIVAETAVPREKDQNNIFNCDSYDVLLK